MGTANTVIDAFWAGGTALVTMDCPACGVRYALNEAYRNEKRATGQGWKCPNGCSLHFPATETLEAKELRLARARVAEAEATAERHRTARVWAEKQARGANIKAGKAKAALKRVHDRVHAGVCPHCNRTFKQLAAHMATKHKEHARG